MKKRYLLLICALVLAMVVFLCLVFGTSLGQHPRFENAIVSVGIFVALLAAIIALSSSNPKEKNGRCPNSTVNRQDERRNVRKEGFII